MEYRHNFDTISCYSENLYTEFAFDKRGIDRPGRNTRNVDAIHFIHSLICRSPKVRWERNVNVSCLTPSTAILS